MKKTTQSTLHKRFKWISFIVLAFVFVSLVSMKPSNSPYQDFSGEEIFKGLYFLSGPVAEKIPELQERIDVKRMLHSAKDNDEIKMEGLLIDQINKTDPAFFTTFKKAMTSGNQLQIAKELSLTEDVVLRATAAYLDITLSDIKSAKEQIIEKMGANKNALDANFENFKAGRIKKEEFGNNLVKILNTGGSIDHSFAINPSNKICCIPFLTVLVCDVAVVINIAGYINVVLSAAVAVAVAGWVTLWTPNNVAGVESSSDYKHNSLINSVAVILNRNTHQLGASSEQATK